MQALGDVPIEEVFERFDEALEQMRARTPMPAEQFYALQDQARLKAFTVSNVGQMDVVQQVLGSLETAIEQGTDLQSWKDEIGPALEAAWQGEVENPAHRLDTIYRTNVQTAFSHGRVRQMREPAVAGLRPFFLFDAVNDHRTTDICSARDGVLLPADDPWWLTNTPPLHFKCRSGIRSLRRAQAERRGGVNPPDREVEFNAPGKGFGAAPSRSPAQQVAPFSPAVDGHPALEGARLRKEAEFRRAEDERQRQQSERVAELELEARRRPFTAEEASRLPAEDVEGFLGLTGAQMDAGEQSGLQSKRFSWGLTSDELAAVHAWTSGYYDTIRSIQRGGVTDPELYRARREYVRKLGFSESEAKSRKHVADAYQHRVHLERALAKWRGNQTASKVVYRGMGGLSGEAIRKLELAGELELGGLSTSASWDAAPAHLFERLTQEPGTFGVMLKLKTRSGMPIETMSKNPSEYEVLLPGDLRFRIVSIKRLTSEDWDADATQGTLLIEAEEI